MGRWKDRFPPDQLGLFESLVGDYLKQLGYALSGSEWAKSSLSVKGVRTVYRAYYEFKQWAKINTPLSRLMVNYSGSLIDK